MASSKVSSLTASDALAGTELFYADGLASAVAADVKVTSTQIKTWTSASPTLVTPVLGVATGTSIALGGATLGTNALAVTGSANISGTLTLGVGSAVLPSLTFGVANTGLFGTAGGNVVVSAGGVARAYFGSSTFNLISSVGVGWVPSTTDPATSVDTTLSRNAAGIIQFGTTAANAAGSLLATNGTFTGGTLIADNGAAAVSPFIVKDNGSAVFTIADGGGVTTTAGLTTGSNIISGGSVASPSTVIVGQLITWANNNTTPQGTSMDGRSNGNLVLTNFASTDFGLLKLGGTTSSFPAIKRSSALIQIRLADDSAYAPFEANTVRTATAYTVATLPAAGTAGRMAYVTDALAPSFLTTVVGGGAVVAPVFDNGTNWVGA